MFPTNPQCGSQVPCIPVLTCLFLIKLNLSEAEMTKKPQRVGAKDNMVKMHHVLKV